MSVSDKRVKCRCGGDAYFGSMNGQFATLYRVYCDHCGISTGDTYDKDQEDDALAAFARFVKAVNMHDKLVRELVAHVAKCVAEYGTPCEDCGGQCRSWRLLCENAGQRYGKYKCEDFFKEARELA